MQGVDRAVRWIKTDDVPTKTRKSARLKRIAAYLTACMSIAALEVALNMRNDELKKRYAQLSNYTKNNYFIIPKSNGKYFAIPKPREFAIPISMFERLAEATYGRNSNSFDDFWEYITDNTLPGVLSGLAQGDINSALGDLGIFGT